MKNGPRELVVISGKGGTGKTSLTASFAALAGAGAVLADCDVDAADLHLLLSPAIRRRETFKAGREAVIRTGDCIGCGACLAHCRFDAIRIGPGGAGEAVFSVDPVACEGCRVCVDRCPVKAIDFQDRDGGEWYVSDTRHGPMVHARLNPGGENSGKLVSRVREAARDLAVERKAGLVLVDGPPGIGCPVIATLTGADFVLVVTEPTLTGAHDMKRVLELAGHFNIPAAVCVNKWDINGEQAEAIEEEARRMGAATAGRVRYDRAATEAQLRGLAVVEAGTGPLADDMRRVWEALPT